MLATHFYSKICFHCTVKWKWKENKNNLIDPLLERLEAIEWEMPMRDVHTEHIIYFKLMAWWGVRWKWRHTAVHKSSATYSNAVTIAAQWQQFPLKYHFNHIMSSIKRSKSTTFIALIYIYFFHSFESIQEVKIFHIKTFAFSWKNTNIQMH